MAKQLTQETIKQCIQLYQEGWSSEKIGKQVGSKAQTITKYLKEAGVEIRGPKKKLTEDDKIEMCRLYQEGLSAPKIAEKFDVTHVLVLRYLEQAGIDRRSAEEAHRIFKINEDFFDVIDTEEKAYFLGFLYADGGNVKEANFIRLDLSSVDREILEKFASLIYVDDPHSHIKEQTREKNGSQYHMSYLNINSKHVCEVLEKHGCGPRKTFTLTFPEWLPKHLVRHFIRGYFDGDGGININTRTGQSSSWKLTSTLFFTNKIKQILTQELGVHLCTYKAAHSEVYDACTSGDRQVRKIMAWLYDGATIYLKRKHDKYQELLAAIAETDRLIEAGTRGYQKRYLHK